jgi:beta-lactamase regulating signal transducer with metallopeptidase domain
VELVANWLWQGIAVALAATAILHVFPRMSATTRYRGWLIALTLVLLLPLIPAVMALAQPEQVTTVIAGSPVPSLTIPLPSLPWWPTALLFAAWMAWVSGSLLRLGGALIALRRAKAIASAFPAEREAHLHGWRSVRGTGRHAALIVSEEVRSAGVLGLRAPAIAVAPALLHELSDSELDQILVHEWAHVQRRDDIGRLYQVFITAVAGLHPAVWWINRRLHIERESACDDWTINVTGAPKGYAACLTKLASLATTGNDDVLVPAAWSSSSLRTRVVRLLDRSRNRSTRFTVTSLAIAPVLATIAVAAGSVALVIDRPLDFPLLVPVVRTSGVTVPAVEAREPIAVVSPALDRRAIAQKEARATRAVGGKSENTASPVAGMPEARLPEATHTVPTFDAVAVENAPLPGTTAPAPTLTDMVRAQTAAAASATPWSVAADAGIAIGDAGVAVGRGSKKGAVATAGFFSRLGKSIARSF